jgi:hypothetical protein
MKTKVKEETLGDMNRAITALRERKMLQKQNQDQPDHVGQIKIVLFCGLDQFPL